MKDSTQSDLKKIEKAINKLRNNMKRADLDYTVQASISSTDPTLVRYAAQMTAPANGLAPVTFIASTADQVIEQIKEQTKNIDLDAVEKAYHEAQIEACKRTIQNHEERIEEIVNPKSKEPEAEPEENKAEETTEK